MLDKEHTPVGSKLQRSWHCQKPSNEKWASLSGANVGTFSPKKLSENYTMQAAESLHLFILQPQLQSVSCTVMCRHCGRLNRPRGNTIAVNICYHYQQCGIVVHIYQKGTVGFIKSFTLSYLT